VFPALNAVEAALCGTLWLLVGPEPGLVAATALLGLQIFKLTPDLRRLGERKVLAALEASPCLVKVVLSDAQREAFCRRRREPPPPRATIDPRTLHLGYIAAEVVKLACLGGLAAGRLVRAS